jgi:hypothetical protein
MISIVARNIASDCDPRFAACAPGTYVGGTSVQLFAYPTTPPPRNPGPGVPFGFVQGAYGLGVTTIWRYDPATGRSDAKSDFVRYQPPPPGTYYLAVVILGSVGPASAVDLYDSWVFPDPVTIGSAAPASKEVRIVEYHNAAFDHYFMTSLGAEIALCDASAPPCAGWAPTGFTFGATRDSAMTAAEADVCRFYNDSFVPSSHFYALRGEGCETTLTLFPDWKLESDALFAVQPVPADGDCGSGTVPVYRLYNGGIGGSPNHRFVTNADERQRMIESGWIPEGYGIGVAMCAPAD